MDYSSSIHETDDPAGESPWGNSPGSSPKQSRTGFSNLAGEPISSPFPYASQDSNGLDNSVESEGFPRPGTATTASDTEVEAEDPEPVDTQDSYGEDETTADVESQPAATPVQPQGDASSADASQEQQPQKPTQPQYRLQVKITGLERTGKKDPLLRFDVYVCISLSQDGFAPLTGYRPTSPDSARPNTEMSEDFTPSLSSLPITLYPRTRKHLSLPSPLP